MEKIKINGIFEMKTFQKKENDLILIDYFIDKNMVVDVGREKICRLLANDTGNNWLSSLGFGTNGTDATAQDNTLTDSIAKSLNSFSYPDNTSISFDWDLGLLEGTGMEIREYGLLCDDGVLFSRKVRPVIDKKIDILLEGTWTIKFL